MARFHRLLRINLTYKAAAAEEIPPLMERLFLGGKALASAYLYNELKEGIDPLGPENKMIIAAGPLTGTIAPASSRFEIVTKSPLTGIYLDCSSGGHFGCELKAAGFDLAIIEGVSEKPVIIFIENDEVSFIDAAGLWGLESYDTEKAVRQHLGKPDIRVLSIGPAGENLVKFACLSNDFSRNAARGGSGAVLGSKRVKAVAVRGTRDIPVDDLKKLRKASARAKTVIFGNPWVEGQRRYGTVRSVGIVNANGFLPTENFTGGCIGDAGSIDETAFEKRVGKVLSCGECPVACSKGYSRKNVMMEGPEYETVGLFGPNLGINDPDAIAGFNYQCNRFGLDTITSGALIGSLLSTEIFEGEPGSRAEIIADLLEKIAYRRGIGDLLAEGPEATAKELGLEYQMPHIKGLAFPAYDPRVSPGTALAYMTADRGACHLRAWPVGRELSGLWAEDDIDSRVDFVKNQQEEKAAEESLTVCQFVYGIGLLDDVLGEMLSASTGEDWDFDRMKTAGERCWTLSRLFNCREGISRKDDYLPVKFSSEGIKNGPLEGKLMSLDTQNYMLGRYYMLRGWDDNGIPGKELLERLELGERLHG